MSKGLLFFLLGCILSCYATQSFSQEPEKPSELETLNLLSRARNKRLDGLKAIKESLESSLKEALDVASKANATNTISRLSAEQEALNDSMTIPKSPELAIAVATYLDKRRTLASEMYAAYQSAITALDQPKMLKSAAQIQTEMTSFVEREKKFLGDNNVALVAAPSKKKKLSTAKQFSAFCQTMDDSIGAAMDQTTAAKQREAVVKLGKDLDDQLKDQKWTLYFKINNVTAGRGKSDLSVDVPKGFSVSQEPEDFLDLSPGDIANFRSEFYSRKSITVRIPYDKALKLEPGEFVKVDGTPRLHVATTQYGYNAITPSVDAVTLFRKRVRYPFSDLGSKGAAFTFYYSIVMRDTDTKLLSSLEGIDFENQ